MTHGPRSLVQRTLCGLLAALGLGHAALADDAKPAPLPLLPKYQQECSSCHLAYRARPAARGFVAAR